MARFLSLLQTAACAAGASGLAGTAPGLAALEILLRDESPGETWSPRPAATPRDVYHGRPVRALPPAGEFQRCLRETPLSS